MKTAQFGYVEKRVKTFQSFSKAVEQCMHGNFLSASLSRAIEQSVRTFVLSNNGVCENLRTQQRWSSWERATVRTWLWERATVKSGTMIVSFKFPSSFNLCELKFESPSPFLWWISFFFFSLCELKTQP